jgi:DNA-binding SARP family transcriptional activator
MDKLEVRLLGGFELARGGQVLDQLPLRAARSLLAFLVLNRERAHTRDLLAGTFWPDFDEARARKRLSQALWQVQTTLGENDGQRYLIGTPDTIRFNPEADFWLDVDAFEGTVAKAEGADRADETGALGRAVDLYRGDLLAGFYDDWLFPDQDRLRTLFLGALERLADLSQARGDYETALGHARRLAQEDEFDEGAHRRVMRLAVLLGRHNEALKQFEECRRILAEELGTEPSSETIELHEATLADRDSGGRAIPPHEESPLFVDADSSPFVGRDTERARFAERLDGVLEGTGGIVLVEGESGVGKTRLLNEVVEDARWRGMDVLWGRSAPSGGRPFGPIGEALRMMSDLRVRQLGSRLDATRIATLAPLIPRLGVAGSETPMGMADERDRMHEAIGAAFQAIAATAPTLVVLEDVHWSDEDTVQALSHLASRVENDRVLFAVSYRHGEARERSEVWDLLRTLDRLSHCERVSLSAYSPAQTEELIRRSLGLPEVSGEFSERLHRETGGIPLFIVETLRALYERDSLEEAEAPAEEMPPIRDRLPVTPTVHALIRHRLDGLEPSSRKTLELVAAHDGDLLLAEVVQASELTDDTALGAIDDLLRRRFVEGTGTTFSVGHELMRRVVYDDLTLSRQLDLHRRIAHAVEEHRPDEVELLAHHFETARMPDRAAQYLERAAERAIAVHAYDTAAMHLARASHTLDEIGASDERRFVVAALHEEVLDVLGRRSTCSVGGRTRSTCWRSCIGSHRPATRARSRAAAPGGSHTRTNSRKPRPKPREPSIWPRNPATVDRRSRRSPLSE